MIYALRRGPWSALSAVALPLLFAACSGDDGPKPPSDSGGPTDPDGSMPDPDTGTPTMDASDASFSGFSRGRIACGTDFACALNESGAPVCWGPRYNNTRTPTKTGFTSIAAGGEEVCAIDGAGEITCWDSRSVSPGAVVRDIPKGPFVEVAIGSSMAAEYACARRASGELACWRSADLGQRPELTTPPAGLTFNRISLGANAACGIQMDGTLRCWGGGIVTMNVPTGMFTDLAVDQSIGCAIDAAGRPTCWGPTIMPVFVTNFPPVQKSMQIAGSSQGGLMCSVLSGGSSFCSEVAEAYPQPANNGNVREVAAAETHMCIVHADRSVECQTKVASGPYQPPDGLRVLMR